MMKLRIMRKQKLRRGIDHSHEGGGKVPVLLRLPGSTSRVSWNLVLFCSTIWYADISMPLRLAHVNNAANAVTVVHKLETLVDLGEVQTVRDDCQS